MQASAGVGGIDAPAPTTEIEELLDDDLTPDSAPPPPPHKPPPPPPPSRQGDSLVNISVPPRAGENPVSISVPPPAAAPPAPAPSQPDIIVDITTEEMPSPPATPPPPPVSIPPAPTSQPNSIPPGAGPPPPPAVPPPPPQVAPPPPPAAAPSASPDRAVKSVDAASKKRVRPWWEEMFDDDFLRSIKRPTDRQVIVEAGFIDDRLGLQKGAVILDLACGDGRHAIELTRRGYKVVGFDLSLAMLARASEEAEAAQQKLNFLHGDMREMAYESQFDGIYNWGMSFGYFEEEKNFAIVQKLHRALRPGGVLLLDVCNRDYIAPRQPNMMWFEGEGCICMDETNLDFITSRLKVKRTVMLEDGRTRELDYSIRLYGLNELGKLLHEAGFKVLEVSGQVATPGVFFGSEAPRCIILAERS
jgi:SAM-dependent methyltransferase